ncbi:glycoside hydrolase family 88 protein [Mucilaginibacter robiniae]|uniref:Glycoside hydrolase family 88 protein n=1 Tax=Mucilaginibacter robiniae TaxID=2728022 RepID=A0A7L5DVW1_9SPHI|nr:glycoside hydrolase family 88 protein [Mucilaginibacter robiniae]QJD95235.1 glycoside hydrolase family 88 protein [Mucilaginibacter robiniae]
MKKLVTRTLVGLLLLAVAISTNAQQKLPSKAKVLKAMEQANEYFMKKWPDPGMPVTVKGVTRTSNLWTRAVYYEGLMALYKVDKQQQFYDYAVYWGTKHQWNPRDKVETRNADNQCCGQTYIDLYLLDKQPERIKGIKQSIDNMVNSDKKDDWNWIDALQMAMPVYAQLGEVYHDNRYYEKMYDIYSYSKNSHGSNGLYNTTEHLWWRDKDFVPPYKEPNGQSCYWSRGNGWVVAAMVRVLEIMPKDAPHREEYLKTYKEMVDALIPLQRNDGYWNVSLKDSTHFGGKELSGTALFTYGIAWGINHHVLNKKTYLPVVTQAWNAMVKDCLHPDGMLGYVQGTGKEPKDGQPVSYDNVPDFEDYGLGCFLLAGSEIYSLSK